MDFILKWVIEKYGYKLTVKKYFSMDWKKGRSADTVGEKATLSKSFSPQFLQF